MFHQHVRRVAGITAVLTLSVAAGACGSDDSSGDGDSAGGADIDTVTTCLSDAGFDVTREADQDPALVLPDEYKESVGLIESVTLGFWGDDTKGLGSVAFYDGTDAAVEADEAASGMRTDDVMAGTSGAVAWDYIATAGDSTGLEDSLTGCLS